MADFKTHITTSSVLGVAYGTGAAVGFGVPVDQCLLATGLCSVSGMLPDIDSDHGVPLRESLAFGAAVVPMLLIDRFRHLGFTTDMMVLSGALIYLFIRFGFGWFLRNYTVHRGMFHSIPAALIFAELTYLICDCDDEAMRLFKAAAVFIGFMSHLVLDEFYSLYWYRGRLRKKKSFGTALKLWGPRLWGNVSTFGKLALLTWVVMYEGDWTGHWHHHGEPRIADTRAADGPPNVAGQPLEGGEAANGNQGQRTWLRPPETDQQNNAPYDAPRNYGAANNYAPTPSSGGTLPAPPASGGYYNRNQGTVQPGGTYHQPAWPNSGAPVYPSGTYQNVYPANNYQYQQNSYPSGAYPSGSYPYQSYQYQGYPSGGYSHGRY